MTEILARLNKGRAPAAGPGRAPPSSDDVDLRQVAWCLWMEAAAGAAWAQLAEAGIPAILLKGPGIARWLYRDDEVRVSRDVDLLVAPGNFDRAQTALGALGYQTRLAGAPACEIGPNSMMLLGTNSVWVDLHHRLIGVSDPPGRCWDVLSRHTVALALATGAEVAVLDVPARSAHLALHAAQSGRADEKAMVDLERGLEQLSAEDWQAAADVARELGAMPAFLTGLYLCPAGAQLAERMGLPRESSLELELRTTGAPRESLFFVRLGEITGIGPKFAVIARKLWPTRAFMHANYPLANRGWPGLAAARLWRPVLLMVRGGPALARWRQTRARLRRHRSGLGR